MIKINRLMRKYGDIIVKLIVIVAFICIIASVGSIVYLFMHADQFDKLWKIMIHNINFWIFVITGVVYGFWRKANNPKEFAWIELVGQVIVGFIVTVGLFGAFTFKFSGVHDTEFLNGYVTTAEFYEEWTEEVERTVCDTYDDDGNCTSSHIEYDEVYHPPQWKSNLTTGHTISIPKTSYGNYVVKFGNEKEIPLTRIDQISIGDGDKYVSKWNGEMERIVPASVTHNYVNYLKASKSIFKRQGLRDVYKHLLLNYPSIHSGRYGAIEVNRTLVAGSSIPNEWMINLDRELDQVLAYMGRQKEVNILVYIVGKTDRGFLHALEEHWIYGKKNDVIVVLSIDKFPTVDWAGIMIFYGNEELKIKLRDSIESSSITDPVDFANLIKTQINKNFNRVSMSKLEHLLYDIELPWWVILLIFALDATVIVTVAFIFENNTVREFNFRRMRR